MDAIKALTDMNDKIGDTVSRLKKAKSSELRERFQMNVGVEVDQLYSLVLAGSPTPNRSLRDLLLRMHYSGVLYGMFDFLDEERYSRMLDEDHSDSAANTILNDLSDNDCFGWIAEVRIPYMMMFKPDGTGYRYRIEYGRYQLKQLYATDLEDLVEQIDHQYEMMKLRCLEKERMSDLEDE